MTMVVKAKKHLDCHWMLNSGKAPKWIRELVELNTYFDPKRHLSIFRCISISSTFPNQSSVGWLVGH